MTMIIMKMMISKRDTRNAEEKEKLFWRPRKMARKNRRAKNVNLRGYNHWLGILWASIRDERKKYIMLFIILRVKIQKKVEYKKGKKSNKKYKQDKIRKRAIILKRFWVTCSFFIIIFEIFHPLSFVLYHHNHHYHHHSHHHQDGTKVTIK